MELEIKKWEEETEKIKVDPPVEGSENDVLDLQMVMTNSSLTHEYLRQELEQTRSYFRQEELLAQMAHLKRTYYRARRTLSARDHAGMVALEKDLMAQKQVVFAEYHA